MATFSSAITAEREAPRQALRKLTVVQAGCPAPERLQIERSLAACNIAVIWVDTVAQLLETSRRRSLPIVLDLTFGATLLQAARELRTHAPGAPLFVAISPGRPDLAVEAVLAGASDVFIKPVSGQRMAAALKRESQSADAAGSGSEADEACGDDLYCLSAAMAQTSAAVSRAAAVAGAGVVIRGEKGSGRRAVARAVHAADTLARAHRFVLVDCGAHDGPQLETELFGGAAEPGARDLERVTRTSRVFEARGGTLYLENVAEAASQVQTRLARLLRDRQAVIAGTNEVLPIDLRPIAAIDSDFEAALEDGRVRDDLYRRLAGLHVDVPTLRRRREDIPLLANHFVRRACAAQGIAAKGLTRPTLSLLTALPWRGHAGELKGLLETIVSGSRSSVIALEDLLTYVRLDGDTMTLANVGTLRQARARFESEYIAAILRQHRGRVTEAAKALGIQRPNLYRKMRALKVTRARRA